MNCPNCGKPSHTRSSKYIATGLKEIYYQCTNIECSATFRTREELVNYISKPTGNNMTEAERVAAWAKCQPTRGTRAGRKA
ncbi:ogr/delta-like zinc finger family protein [Serratia phage MQ-4]|nr:ogr/delta-like zinc finger family protein [Serratia phage MQ-4]